MLPAMNSPEVKSLANLDAEPRTIYNGFNKVTLNISKAP